MATCPTAHFIIGPVHLGQLSSTAETSRMPVAITGASGPVSTSSLFSLACSSAPFSISSPLRLTIIEHESPIPHHNSPSDPCPLSLQRQQKTPLARQGRKTQLLPRYHPG